jgi:hypothetical protein
MYAKNLQLHNKLIADALNIPHPAKMSLNFHLALQKLRLMFAIAWAPCVRMFIEAEKEKLTRKPNLTPKGFGANLRCQSNVWSVRQWSYGKPTR